MAPCDPQDKVHTPWPSIQGPPGSHPPALQPLSASTRSLSSHMGQLAIFQTQHVHLSINNPVSPPGPVPMTPLPQSLPHFTGLGRNDCVSAQLCSFLCFFFMPQLRLLFFSLPLVCILFQGRDSGSFIAISSLLVPAWHTCWMHSRMDGWRDG